MKKEFARFFGDRRMLFTLLLPAILIYVMYSILGSALQDMHTPDDEYCPTAYIANMPDSLMDSWDNIFIVYIGTGDAPDAAAAKEKVALKQADICVVFPADFDRQVTAYDVRTSSGPAPNIEVYYNSTEINSQTAYGTIMELLDDYEYSLVNKFDINRDIANADLATEKDAAANIIASLMPMLLIMFLYSGCSGIAPESIAGEKERGTIGALLVSPLKRSELAIGKILSLGVLALLSGLVTAMATILSLPKMMGEEATMEAGLNVNIYGVQDFFFLALIILSTVLLLVTLISIVSAFAKTVKEAGTAVTPMVIVVMLIAVTAMFGGGAQTRGLYYLIPIYNSVQGMSGVFSLNYSAMNIIFAVLSNIIYACVGGFILTKMFNSEKVMFSR